MQHTIASWFDDSEALACAPDRSGIAVANKYLPCGSHIRICSRSTCVTATVEDRGPYVAGRELDLNPVARDALGCDTCEVSYAPVVGGKLQ